MYLQYFLLFLFLFECSFVKSYNFCENVTDPLKINIPRDLDQHFRYSIEDVWYLAI